MSEQDAGLVVVATLLLFPTAVVVYGGLKVWFAAKEAVEKKARAKGRQEERVRVRQALTQELERLGLSVPEESINRIVTGQPAASPPPPPLSPYRRRFRRRNGNGG